MYLFTNAWGHTKLKGLLSDPVDYVIICMSTARIENVIEVVFLGLENFVSSIIL